MFCRKCGRELKDNAVFCPKCGTKFNAPKKAVKIQPPVVDSNRIDIPVQQTDTNEIPVPNSDNVEIPVPESNNVEIPVPKSEHIEVPTSRLDFQNDSEQKKIVSVVHGQNEDAGNQKKKEKTKEPKFVVSVSDVDEKTISTIRGDSSQNRSNSIMYAVGGVIIALLVVVIFLLVKDKKNESDVAEHSEKDQIEVAANEELQEQLTPETVENNPSDISENVEAAEEIKEADQETELVGEEELVEELEEEKSEYILPQSDSELLSKSDLEGLSQDELRIARNEIYARHGRRFKDEELQKYFDECSWYNGTIDPDSFQDSMLSDIEHANKDLIVKYEEEKGYR